MKPAESFDRRVFGRRPTNLSAQVRIGYRFVPCTIKDLSEGGALLEFSEPVDLPQRIWLSWSEHKSEIVCDVRHTRRNSAGVQFARSQPLALRPAVAPSEPLAAHPVAVAKPTARARAAFDLVAERRRANRQTATEHGAAGPTEEPPSSHLEPPRDLSVLMKSLKAAAQSILDARAAAAVPRLLAARLFAGTAVEPPPACRQPTCPFPWPASRFAAPGNVLAAGRRRLRSIASALLRATRR